ncbi:MAG: SAM-dependent methyltransferase, partial [Planctomycetes bacterium]|nr:SAM-dependent methyltransferase [Planctomycetota bacterium]
TAGSLAKLFRSIGFDIDDLYLDYDGQYIIVAAFATGGTNSPYLEEEKDMPHMLRAIENFHDRCIYTINYWQNMIGKDTQPAEKIVLWGSGPKAVAFLNTLEVKSQIDYVVDINPYRQGKYIPGTGQRIVSPEFLKEYQPDKVIIMNPVYHGEIAETIADLNVTTDLLTV